jgi:hypothetical protein
MMANSSINLVGLDFSDIKGNLKDYLKRSNSPFRDYNYEGSNLSALLDLLAYNTYLNNYYLNMVASEMFLDTASLRDSVVSHAKELNYIPQSFKSAIARVSFIISPTTALGSIVVPKGTTFTSRIGSNNFTFSIADNITINANTTDGKFYVTTNIYEGAYTSDTFVYTSNADIKYILSNQTIDLSSLTVSVISAAGAAPVEFSQANSYLGLTSQSNVFFLQAATNDQYEILFGDNISGSEPLVGSTIVARYRACNGELPNGATLFNIDGPIQNQANISAVSTIFSASGGAVSESLSSIKRNATRHYQNQERAVTATDYENLLLQKFPEIQAISAYGGEELDPPQFGKVFIAVDVVNADGTPEVTKQKFVDYLTPKCPLSIEPIVVNPEFLFCLVNSNVKYNLSTTTLKDTDLETIVKSAISRYNSTNLNDFKSTLKYSKLLYAIDSSNPSIISNDTDIVPYKEFTPILNATNNYKIDFGFAINGTNKLADNHSYEESHGVNSTEFIYKNILCTLEDDGNGSLFLIAPSGNSHRRITSIGTVDYTAGVINLYNFSISSFTGSAIRIFVNPINKDISSLRNTILTIRDNDINVEMISTRE